jgi:hypothetical protein
VNASAPALLAIWIACNTELGAVTRELESLLSRGYRYYPNVLEDNVIDVIAEAANAAEAEAALRELTHRLEAVSDVELVGSWIFAR